ncbi:MAG: DinB family protein [Propionibacteriaceae bacterium]
MQDTRKLLADGFTRIAEAVPQVLDGLSSEDIEWQPAPTANSIGWLVWHLARVEDDHLTNLANALGRTGPRPFCAQVWRSGRWNAKMQLPYGDHHGYGHTPEQVSQFHLEDPGLLVAYYAAVHKQTLGVLKWVKSRDYRVVIDTRWTPPVTGGVRIVSVLNDVTQHIGQAAYVKGLLEAR